MWKITGFSALFFSAASVPFIDTWAALIQRSEWISIHWKRIYYAYEAFCGSKMTSYNRIAISFSIWYAYLMCHSDLFRITWNYKCLYHEKYDGTELMRWQHCRKYSLIFLHTSRNKHCLSDKTTFVWIWSPHILMVLISS